MVKLTYHIIQFNRLSVILFFTKDHNIGIKLGDFLTWVGGVFIQARLSIHLFIVDTQQKQSKFVQLKPLCVLNKFQRQVQLII